MHPVVPYSRPIQICRALGWLEADITAESLVALPGRGVAAGAGSALLSVLAILAHLEGVVQQESTWKLC